MKFKQNLKINIKRYTIAMAIVIFFSVPLKISGKSNNRIRKKSVRLIKKLPGFDLISTKNIEYKDKNITVKFYSQRFAQGNAVYIEIYKNKPMIDNFSFLSLKYGNAKVPMTKFKWGFRGFLGISPKTKPGEKRFVVTYLINRRNKKFFFFMRIYKTAFPVYRRALDLGKFSDTRRRTPEEISFIKKSQKKKRKAFSHRGPDLFTGRMSHPRDMHYITSPFWTKRIYKRYKYRGNKKIKLKSRISVHRGLDFRGETGAPVFSIARGEVVLAAKLYYEGNIVIIDHGNKIFSYFMHMNSLETKAGDIVNPGDLIGRVGSTGVSTAAHLHAAFLIRGVFVNPLSVMALPVRD